MSWGPTPEYADWWYVLSWRGIIIFGAIAAFATSAVVVFTMLQFWSDAVRDQKAEDRNRAMEVQVATSNAKTAGLEAESARLKLELEREIQKGAPRALTAEQRTILSEELRGKISKLNIAVQQQLEPRRFAWEIVMVLTEAGIKFVWIDLPPGDTLPIASGQGLFMYSPLKARSEEALKDDPLFKALKRAKLYGGFAAEPLASPGAIWSLTAKGIQSFNNRLGDDEHVLYVFEKTPW